MNSVVALVLAGSLMQRLGEALQKHGISQSFPAIEPGHFVSRFRQVAGGLLRNGRWMLGGLLFLLSSLFFVQAFARGDLSVIMPLAGVSNLFSVAIGVLWLGERMTGVEWLAAGLIVAGAVCIGLDAGSASQASPSLSQSLVLYASLGALTLLLLARRQHSRRVSAELSLACAAALQIAAQNLMAKAATGSVTRSLGSFDVRHLASLQALALAPELYLCLLSGVLVFVLIQSAFANGRVAIVVPLLTAGNILVTSLTGFLLLGESAHGARLAGIAVMVLGTCLLTAERDGRSPSSVSRPRDRRARLARGPAGAADSSSRSRAG